jgi:Tfp pilus assembly protein PilX
MTPLHTRRALRKRQGQEGVVLLVVIMLLLMATSTALWALQSTVFEQKASTSVLEMVLSRQGSECAALAGIALEENGTARASLLDNNWTASAAPAQSLPRKYNVPPPTGVLTSPMWTDPLYQCGDQMARTVRGRLLHESYQYGNQSATSGPFTNQGSAMQPRSLVVITGFGELFLPNDQPDRGGVRLLHEVTTQTRAFFDR